MAKLNLKKLLLLFFLSELLFSYTPAFGQANPPADYRSAGVSSQIEEFLCSPKGTGSGILYQCINQLYKFAIVLAAVVGVFFIVIAGYVYMSAEGNTEAVDKAKNILVSTITAIVILLVGYVLLKAINPDIIQFHSVQPPEVVFVASTLPTYGGTISMPPNCTRSRCVIDGFDLARYTPDAGYQANVFNIINSMAGYDFNSPAGIDAYIRARRPSSPITGTMVWNASLSNNNVDPRMIVAIMQADSSIGTQGIGAHDFNPGNIKFVGQPGATRGPVGTDGGTFANFGDWQTGVNFLAKWLNDHRG